MPATLFETEPEQAERPRVDRETGKMLARLEQVKALVEFGYDPDIVCEWTYERAGVRLNALRAEAKRTIARAKSKAKLIDCKLPPTDEKDFRTMPAAATAIAAPVERCVAAKAIQQTLADGDAEQVMFEVQAAVWCLDDDRVRSLAGYLVRVLRGE